jgi:hypothetical protein
MACPRNRREDKCPGPVQSRRHLGHPLNSLRQIQPSSKIHLHGSICCNSNNGTEIGGFGWVEEVPGVNAQERSREELLAFTNACGFVTCARNRVGNQCAKRLEWRFLQLPVVQRVVPPVPGEQASAWFWPRRSNSVGMRHAQQLKVVLKKNTCPHEAAAGEWRPAVSISRVSHGVPFDCGQEWQSGYESACPRFRAAPCESSHNLFENGVRTRNHETDNHGGENHRP